MEYSKNILEAISRGIENALALYEGAPIYQYSNGRGRPTTTSKILNLYIDKGEKQEERVIRAWFKNIIKKDGRIFYLDNNADVENLRRLYINAVYKFMEKNRPEEFNWEEGDKVYSMRYNLNNSDSFAEDLRKSYKKLCLNPNFPSDQILPVTPKETRRRGLSQQQLKEVQEYIASLGKGVDIDEYEPEILEQLSQKKLKSDGEVYVVCRPTRSLHDNSDPNAPALLYKLNAKYCEGVSANTVRYVYTYQCMKEYNSYVNYMYVSPIHLDKYMKKERY